MCDRNTFIEFAITAESIPWLIESVRCRDTTTNPITVEWNPSAFGQIDLAPHSKFLV